MQKFYSAPSGQGSLASTSAAIPNTVSSTYRQTEYSSASRGNTPVPPRAYSELSGALDLPSAPGGSNATVLKASAEGPAHAESSKMKRDDSWMGVPTLWDQDSPVAKRARAVSSTEAPSRAECSKRKRNDSGMDLSTLRDRDSPVVKKARTTTDVGGPHPRASGETSASGCDVHSASVDTGSEKHSGVDGVAEHLGLSSDPPKATQAEVAGGIMALLAGPSTTASGA